EPDATQAFAARDTRQAMAPEDRHDGGKWLGNPTRPLRPRCPSATVHQRAPDYTSFAGRASRGSGVSGPVSRSPLQGRQVVPQEISDALEHDVGGRISAHLGGVVRVVTLPGEDRGDALAPGGLDGGAEPRLVVDEHVVIRRISPFDVLQLALL